ncbi:MAG: 50S ribosomal protein L34, partial [Candidatus Omnitrophica bacterium]|nr:50S ribosomal protein L34 [Candidatus Omnitrophota bacterium]
RDVLSRRRAKGRKQLSK